MHFSSPKTDLDFGEYDPAVINNTLYSIKYGYDHERFPAWGESDAFGAFQHAQNTLLNHMGMYGYDEPIASNV